MNPITREWISKAEGDYATARRELKARRSPNYDAACFHAQQCIEKYLKARLQEENIAFGKTHDLLTLLDLLLPVEPLWEALRSSLHMLSTFAIAYRYPGDSADKDIAQQAVQVCSTIRQIIRITLGMP